jgi:hypothetical protein
MNKLSDNNNNNSNNNNNNNNSVDSYNFDEKVNNLMEMGFNKKDSKML